MNSKKYLIAIAICFFVFSLPNSASAVFNLSCGLVSNYDSEYSCEENKLYQARRQELSPYQQFFAEAKINLTIETSESQYKKWLARLIDLKQKTGNKTTNQSLLDDTESFQSPSDDTESLRRQLIQSLNEQLKSLKLQLAELQQLKASSTTEQISVGLKSSSGVFKKIRNPNGPEDSGEGTYKLQVEVTAGKNDLYIPVSIATGRVSNGLIYLVEGSDRAEADATVSCNGENAIIVTSGSISYCKVPAGESVTFKVLVTITSPLKEEFRVVLTRINYKLNPNDSRYKKYLTDIHTKLLKFR